MRRHRTNARNFVSTAQRLDEVALLLLIDALAEGVIQNYGSVLARAREWALGIGEVFWVEPVPKETERARAPIDVLGAFVPNYSFPWQLRGGGGSPGGARRPRRLLGPETADTALIALDAYEFVVCSTAIRQRLKYFKLHGDRDIAAQADAILHHRYTLQLQMALALALFLRVQRRNHDATSGDAKFWRRVQDAWGVKRLDSKRIRRLRIFGSKERPVLGHRWWSRSVASDPQPWIDICIAVAQVMGWSANTSYSATLRQFEQASRDIENLPGQPMVTAPARSRHHSKPSARARRSVVP